MTDGMRDVTAEAERIAQERGWCEDAPPPAGPEDYGVSSPPAKAEPDQRQAPPLQLTDPTSLQGVAIPERRWIVPDWLPVGYTTGLYGDGGTGKSLLAMQLMTCCATGTPFFGMDVEPVRTLGIFCEDAEDELHRRQDAINGALGVDFGDLDGMRWVSRVGFDNLLMTFEGGAGELTEFWQQVRDASLSFGARLVVLDTAADLFGGNENDRGQVRQFVQAACTRIAREIDGAVLLCAHPSRSGLATGSGDSGSTGWNAAFRSRLYFERLPATDDDPEPDPDIRKLSRKKANYAAAGVELQLRYSGGAFEVEGGGSAETWIDRQTRENRAEQTFLALLDKAEAEGRPVGHKPRASNYAPKAFAKRPDRDGFRRQDFEQAMERLFQAGAIEVQQRKDEHRNTRDYIVKAA
jgi:RecA-family ATPase